MSLLDEARTYLETHKPGKAYIGLVHRLDRPASGVVAFAKTSKAAARLSECFRNRIVNKHYVCVVNGHLEEKQGFLHDHLVKSSKGKVRILNTAASAAFPPRNGKGQGLRQGQGKGGVIEARLQYSVLLQITRPAGRNLQQSLLHVQLDTGQSVRRRMSREGGAMFFQLYYLFIYLFVFSCFVLM